jgi:hypothetical protein
MEKQERQQPEQERQPEVRRPEEPVKDLEPDEESSQKVKGGMFTTLSDKL